MVPGFVSFESSECPALLAEDRRGGFGPHERFRIGGVLVEIVFDRRYEIGNARESTASDPLGGDLSKEPLDEIKPGSARWREVERKAWMLFKPCPHLGRFVCPVVVDDKVQVKSLMYRAVDLTQKLQKLS